MKTPQDIMANLKDWMGHEGVFATVQDIVPLRKLAQDDKLTEKEKLSDLAESLELRFRAAQKIFDENVAPYERVNLSDKEKEVFRQSIASMSAHIEMAMDAVKQIEAIQQNDYDTKLRSGEYSPPRDPSIPKMKVIRPDTPLTPQEERLYTQGERLAEAGNAMKSLLDEAISKGQMKLLPKLSGDYYNTPENKLDQKIVMVKNALDMISDDCKDLIETLSVQGSAIAQCFRGGERTDPKPREGGWTGNS